MNQGPVKKKNVLLNEKGFTLIEIIAVLIILGILAAVAVPKYFDLQADARQSAVNAAGAELQARVNQKFAKDLLGNATCADASNITLAEIYNNDLGNGWVVLGTLPAINLNHPTATGNTAINYTLTLPTCN